MNARKRTAKLTGDDLREILEIHLEHRHTWEELAEEEGVCPEWLKAKCQEWCPPPEPGEEEEEEETGPTREERIAAALEDVRSGALSPTNAAIKHGLWYQTLLSRIRGLDLKRDPTEEEIKIGRRMLAQGATEHEVVTALGLTLSMVQRCIGRHQSVRLQAEALIQDAGTMTVKEIRAALDATRKQVDNALRGLVEQGRIQRVASGIYSTTGGGDR